MQDLHNDGNIRVCHIAGKGYGVLAVRRYGIGALVLEVCRLAPP